MGERFLKSHLSFRMNTNSHCTRTVVYHVKRVWISAQLTVHMFTAEQQSPYWAHGTNRINGMGFLARMHDLSKTLLTVIIWLKSFCRHEVAWRIIKRERERADSGLTDWGLNCCSFLVHSEPWAPLEDFLLSKVKAYLTANIVMPTH